MRKTKNTLGAITPALLVISTAFIIVIYGIIFILAQQFDFSRRDTASELSINIAEAGIDYYKWHLAHDPDDFTDGTGVEGQLYEHEYIDPQGASVGVYSLEITPPEDGSTVVTIRSTGWSNEFPNVKRTIEARYGKSSFAEYSYLSNASSWYGANMTINGRIHSNNGIRMDGTNLSLVTSAKETYKCGSETGCHPPDWKPGVWGAGGDQGLWQYPVPAVDFDSISYDFAFMKEAAEENGLYIDGTSDAGYHLLFSPNGTVTVKRVTQTGTVRGYAVPGQGLGKEGQGGCRNRNQTIEDEVTIGTYAVSETPIIFVEDNVWIEGTVSGRVTVVAAEFPIQSGTSFVWILGSILYSSYDGSDSLGLISQNDVYLARDLPEDFYINAALMAQKGRVLRHGYLDSCGDSPEAVKDKMTINGSLISYEKSYWNYGPEPESGFLEREINYDANMFTNPPPYFPDAGDYEFVSWKEE